MFPCINVLEGVWPSLSKQEWCNHTKSDGMTDQTMQVLRSGSLQTKRDTCWSGVKWTTLRWDRSPRSGVKGGVCILQCRCRTFGCCDLVRLANTFSYELLVVTAKWAPLVRFVLGVPHQKTPENTLMSHTSLRPRYTFISAFASGCTLVSRRHTTTTVTVQATTPSHPRSSASMPPQYLNEMFSAGIQRDCCPWSPLDHPQSDHSAFNASQANTLIGHFCLERRSPSM